MKMNKPAQPEDSELRAAILKQGKVTKAKVVYSQKMYSNGTASPIQMSNQDVVEIGIDELMQLIATRDAQRDQQKKKELLGQLPEKDTRVHDKRYGDAPHEYFRGLNHGVDQTRQIVERFYT